MSVYAWWRVWHPHIAATRDGLIVRRATSTVLLPWHNIKAAHVNGRYGIFIQVRVGQHVSAAVPYCPILQELTKGDADAADAVALIEAKALFADRV